jgi:hypothetical protein
MWAQPRPVARSEGNGTEAGIRQKLKSDGRPVLIDEFDLYQKNIEGVIRLARSAYSSEAEVLKGRLTLASAIEERGRVYRIADLASL